MGLHEILTIIGVGIFILGGVSYLIAAFRTSLLWGFGCLLVAPVAILYLIFYWNDAKKPFAIQVLGMIVIASGTYGPRLIGM